MCRDWRFTPHYGLPLMPAIISGGPKRVGSAIGDPRDAQRSCIVLHDPHLAAGAIQTVHAHCQTNNSAVIFLTSLRKKY